MALRALAAYASIGDARTEKLDLTRTRDLSKSEMESQILALTERGRRMDAVKLARTVYGCSMRDALAFIDGLSK